MKNTIINKTTKFLKSLSPEKMVLRQKKVKKILVKKASSLKFKLKKAKPSLL